MQLNFIFYYNEHFLPTKVYTKETPEYVVVIASHFMVSYA